MYADLGARVLSPGGVSQGRFQGGADPYLHVRAAQAFRGEAVRGGDQQEVHREVADRPATLLR